jgi:uncharacterized protein (TIGR03435 family)
MFKVTLTAVIQIMLGPRTRIGLAALLVVGAIAGQQPTASVGPRFEVVSIRPVPPNAPPIMRDQFFAPVLPGGQFVDSRTDLFFMIAFAYDVADPSIRLVGLPDWAGSRTFSVSAKPAPGSPALSPNENKELVRVMLRAMLEERFHLRLHTENRQDRVYSLEVAKGGFRFKTVDPPMPPEMEGPVNAAMGDSGGRIMGKKATMTGMARMLVIFLKRPVVDATGLKGYYDFDVKWSAPESPDGKTPADSYGTAGGGLLISTLRDQFGLRLTSSTGPVKYWVVDHVEPPTEN